MGSPGCGFASRCRRRRSGRRWCLRRLEIRGAMSSVLEVRELRYELPGSGKKLVDGVSFSVGAGETLVLLGRSGAGKTSTLKLINRLLTPTSGTVRIAGEPATAVAATQLRRRIGYVIQEIGLFPHFTVAANVGLLARLEHWPHERTQRRVSELLGVVGLYASA